MYGESLDYLSKPVSGSPAPYKKSPGKYLALESKYYQPYTLNKKNSYPPSDQWSNSDFQNLRRVSDDVGNLRQTFDVKSQSKVQHILSKYDYENQQTLRMPQKVEVNLRQTTSSRPRLVDNYRLGASLTDSTHNTSSNFNDRQNRSIKSPNRSENIEMQFNKYKEQLEELETTKKMAEELRKLKEDRRKRLEGKDSKQGSKDGNKDGTSGFRERQGSDFKKKKLEQFYSPKYEKVDIAENLEFSKTVPLKRLDLGKYKINQNEQKQVTNTKEPTINVKQPQTPKITKQFLQASHDLNNVVAKPKYEAPTMSASMKLPLKSDKGEKTGMSTTVDDFVMGKFLGEGRFGTVHQVIHKQTGALFALKKISKESVKKLNMVNQLTLELKLQTYLQHQNLVKLYHHFDDNQNIYLLLEYMEEGTLFSKLKKKKNLPEIQVARHMKQITSAIKYMHENEIAHRDLKPQNIVITNGVCKICDFGWATICDNRRRTCCGTFDYTPPEIFEGEEYDYTVDLWGLGVLTYELLVGKAPFYHIRREQTKNRIVNVEKKAINFPQHLSAKAINFMEGLLKKDPKDRISSEELINHPFLQNLEEES